MACVAQNKHLTSFNLSFFTYKMGLVFALCTYKIMQEFYAMYKNALKTIKQ